MNVIKHIIVVIAVYIRNIINAQHNAERVKFLQDAVNVKRERLVRENKRYTRWRGRAERAERRVKQQVDMLNARERRLLTCDSVLESEQHIKQRLYRENDALKARIAAILQYLDAVEKDRVELARRVSELRLVRVQYREMVDTNWDLMQRVKELEEEIEEKDEKICDLESDLDDMRWAEDTRDEYYTALTSIKDLIEDLDI